MKNFLLIMLIFLFFPVFSVSSDAKNTNIDKTVIIDAGHGGADCGAIGLDDVYEKGLNLSTSLAMRDICELCGYDCILTRETDDDTDGDTSSFNKTADIFARRDLGNANPDALFVSIHMNYSTGPADKGFQVFFGNNGEELAQRIYDAVNRAEMTNRMREVTRAPSNVYLMRKVNIPSVLVECGFISNREDCGLLYERSYRERLALVLFSAIFGEELSEP